MSIFIRPSGRKADELREVKFITDIPSQAEGACMVHFGKTTVLCTASVIEGNLPFWLRGKNQGWVTAEYGMLPRSTNERMGREAAQGKQASRTVEIQRLIARSLRSIINLKLLGKRQIIIDCDVIYADGGTRTAAISGGYIALKIAVERVMRQNNLKKNPIYGGVSAVSAGIFGGQAVLDLDYAEDSVAGADGNFIFSHNGKITEVQSTAEEAPFSEEDFLKMMKYAKKGASEIQDCQEKAIKEHLNNL